MGLQDQIADAAAAEQARQREYTAKWQAIELEKKRRLVAQTFGQPTGERIERLDSNSLEDEYVLPPDLTVEVTRERAIVDGIEFGYKSERHSSGRYLAPVLTCPECGEEHFGHSIYAHKHTNLASDAGKSPWRISDHALARLADDLKSQRADDHRCYQAGTYSVASAARSGADKLKGITPRELLRRADAYLIEKGEW